MPGFRRRSVSPEHAPDREGLPLARETFLLLRGPDRACEGTAGSGGPHSWHLAARVSRERIAPGRSSVRLTSRHRTSERTGLTRRRSRKSPDPKGGTPPCPVAGPLTDTGSRALARQSNGGRSCNPIRFEAETDPAATLRLAVAPGFPGRSGWPYREGLPGPAITPDGRRPGCSARPSPAAARCRDAELPAS